MTDDSNDIQRYREGRMTSAERHALEKRALSDPFLADALEGTETIRPEEYAQDVAELSAKLQGTKHSLFTPIRIAAGIVLILGIGSVIYFVNSPDPAPLALQEEKSQAGPDSVLAAAKADSTTGTMLALSTDTKASESKPGESKVSAAQPAGPAATTGESKSGGSKPAADKVTTEPVKTEAEVAEPTVARTLDEQQKATDVNDVTQAPATGAGAKKEAVAERAIASKAIVSRRMVAGNVSSEEDGTPLPGVNIIVKGTTRGTVTDMQGNYSLELPPDQVKLAYSFIGMETKEVDPGNQPTLNVKMKGDAAQLSEVVVTGQAHRPEDRDDLDKPVIRLAAPIGGIKAYNKYLENNLHYPPAALEKKVKGKVTIKFTVTTSGSLTDFTVVRGLGYGCEDEVVRLVKEGPAWTPSLEDDTPVESEVRVKLKFDPEKVNK